MKLISAKVIETVHTHTHTTKKRNKKVQGAGSSKYHRARRLIQANRFCSNAHCYTLLKTKSSESSFNNTNTCAPHATTLDTRTMHETHCNGEYDEKNKERTLRGLVNINLNIRAYTYDSSEKLVILDCLSNGMKKKKFENIRIIIYFHVCAIMALDSCITFPLRAMMKNARALLVCNERIIEINKKIIQR